VATSDGGTSIKRANRLAKFLYVGSDAGSVMALLTLAPVTLLMLVVFKNVYS
jgi:hypothetical protein